MRQVRTHRVTARPFIGDGMLFRCTINGGMVEVKLHRDCCSRTSSGMN
jgi:hypothetical protein